MLAIAPAAVDPPRVLTAFVHLPIGLTAPGVTPGVSGIKLERSIKNLCGVLDVLLLVVILQVAKSLQIEVVSAGYLRSMHPQDFALARLHFQLQHPDGCVDHLVLNCERIGSRDRQTLCSKLAAGSSIHHGNIDSNSISSPL